MMDYLINAAMSIAAGAHEGQVRKYTGEPYVCHPIAVAGLVRSVTDDEDMFIAAVLHDVVEDTEISLELVSGLFGQRVAGMVSDLTDISIPSDGNRATRKLLDLEHTSMASPEAKTIKLADLIDNTKTIVAFDKDFAKVYMREKRSLLEVLGAGDPVLFKIADDLVNSYFAGR